MSMLLALAAAVAQPVAGCDNKPVLMVVAGPTHDRARMQAYAKAIADSGLYQRLGGYYLNIPAPAATFEGDAPKGYTTLIVRFPCLANARAFWESETYHKSIKPLRLNPSAGDYVVSVYPEAPIRPDMAGKVVEPRYLARFDGSGVPARLGYPAPAGLVLGIQADSAPLGSIASWPTAKAQRLRDDPATGSAHRLTFERATSARLPLVDRPTEIYVLRGSVRLGESLLGAGDYVHIPHGAPATDFSADPGTQLLLFRDRPLAAAPENPMIVRVRGADMPWTEGLVSKEAGAPAPLRIKRLRTDPVTGARTHLVAIDPGVAVPWEVHSTAEEAYLLSGDYHLAECLPDGRRDFAYQPGGYFYRPANLIHSGPESTTKAGAVWLIRTPRTLDAVFYPSCPSAPAAP